MDESTYGTRTAKGEWTPTRRVSYGPLFSWPTRPVAIAKWIVRFPGFLFPWNALYLAVAAVLYAVATPASASMRTFSVGWIAEILARNLVLVVAWYGLFHLRLYRWKSQDTRFKYSARWPRHSDRFAFGSQTAENMAWTLLSGVPVLTAWEVTTHWLFANGHISWLRWSQHPVWFVGMFVLIPLWRELHFYAVHRLIHVPALYKVVHSLHHRNTNPSPWSGLSMHPLEHVVYFSAVAIHWVVPSHPLHAMYNLVHLTMAPVPGHSGFESIELGESTKLDTNGFGHYLHHKYFEVNYSDGAIPFDRWFGSFHDGSQEAHERLSER